MHIPPIHRLTSTIRAPLQRVARWQALGVLAIVVLACGSVNIRPHERPLPLALIDTLPAAPDIVIRAALQEIANEGMRVDAVSEEEGFLETGWYHPLAQRPVSSGTKNPRQAIRLRFRADSIGPRQSQLASEAVIQGTADPSLPNGVAERMASLDHPGHQLLRRVIDSLRARLGG